MLKYKNKTTYNRQ